MNAPERLAKRIRHEIRPRLLRVRRVDRLTPAMLRLTLEGSDLAGFVSAAPDDHVKLVFPAPGQDRPVLPAPGRTLADLPAGQAARDYTPRRHDPVAGTLMIDIVLHGDGPAVRWAAQARPGQLLGVLGPRGSFILPADLDWILLAGDETALPAIGRRLEELSPGTRAIVVVEVADSHEEQVPDSRASVDLHWLHRDGAAPGSTTLLAEAVAALALPPGRGHVWVAAEAATAKALRGHLVDDRGLAPERVKAAAYWTRDAAASG